MLECKECGSALGLPTSWPGELCPPCGETDSRSGHARWLGSVQLLCEVEQGLREAWMTSLDRLLDLARLEADTRKHWLSSLERVLSLMRSIE